MTERFEALLGGYGSRTLIANALGLSREHVTRVLNGAADAPEAMVAVVELLEALPKERWPERWSR